MPFPKIVKVKDAPMLSGWVDEALTYTVARHRRKYLFSLQKGVGVQCSPSLRRSGVKPQGMVFAEYFA